MKKLLGVLVAATSLLLVSGIALANHQWSTFHWPTENRSIEYDDSTTATFDIPVQIGEWNAALPAGVSLVDAGDGAFDVDITEGRLRGIWIGVASILVESATGHILEGSVTLNTPKFNLSAEEWAHVACQEIGHILGLDHDRAASDTCMNDQADPGSAPSPNAHDADELAGMYGHADVVPTPTPTPEPTTPTPTPTPEPDNGGGGPPCSKNPGHPNCRPDAEWVVVHVFPAP